MRLNQREKTAFGLIFLFQIILHIWSLDSLEATILLCQDYFTIQLTFGRGKKVETHLDKSVNRGTN